MMCDGRGVVSLEMIGALCDDIAFVKSVLSFHFMSLNELLPFLSFDAYLGICLLPLIADPLCDIRVLLHCKLALVRDETRRQPVANIRVIVDRLMPD